MNENELVQMIKNFYVENNKVPTIAEFSNQHAFYASSIIRKFGSWNDLLSRAGLKINKPSKRTEEELLNWLKIHASYKYSQIPSGIRTAIENRFGSLSAARKQANLSIVDYRSSNKKRKPNPNAGRPVEYSREMIISGLRSLAAKLGRPPRMKDVSKDNCGFPMSAVLSRFQKFNLALRASELPPVFSYHEFNRLKGELEKLMMNLKLSINDIPRYYDLEINGIKPLFIYDDRIEEVKLTRNEICSSINAILRYKEAGKKIVVFYLVDDSLYENDEIEIVGLMDLMEKLDDKIVANRIKELRLKYDEINRKYIAPLINYEQERQMEDFINEQKAQFI